MLFKLWYSKLNLRMPKYFYLNSEKSKRKMQTKKSEKPENSKIQKTK
jgi:hypothetical protein